VSVEATRDGGDIVMRDSADEATELRWTTPDWNDFIAGIFSVGTTDAARDNQEEILVQGTLRFTSAEWHAFVVGLRSGEFASDGIPGGSWKRSTRDLQL